MVSREVRLSQRVANTPPPPFYDDNLPLALLSRYVIDIGKVTANGKTIANHIFHASGIVDTGTSLLIGACPPLA